MYPVDLHSHTIASSHAYSTIQEYAVSAAQKGLRLFATTDHGPAIQDGAHLWHFVNLRVVPRELEGVIVLRGIEANILPDGLDMPDDVLRRLDVVLAGFHSPSCEPGSREENTERLLRTIAGGLVQIISHPGNPRYPVDARAVAEAATAHGVALEVNNSSFLYTRPGSRDSCLELVRAQAAAGGWIALGSDAHHAHSLGEFSEALRLVRAAGFPEERILNVSPRRVVCFLADRHNKELPGLDLSLFR